MLKSQEIIKRSRRALLHPLIPLRTLKRIASGMKLASFVRKKGK